MIEIKAPKRCKSLGTAPLSVFVAGGISGCPDWQSEFVQLLNDEDLVLFNPRRDDFDISDPSMSEAQIRWEYEHLEVSDIVIFWFPKETMCPITLFELGKCLGNGTDVVVGCHPEYKRAFDLDIQIDLVYKGFKVARSLAELKDQLLWKCKEEYGWI